MQRWKKRCERKVDIFRKKLTIPDSEIAECPERKVKSKIGNIFVNEKILEEYSVKNYEIETYFYEHYKKKIQVNGNRCKFILFRIDAYFSERLLAAEIDGKGHTDRDLILEEKRQEASGKKLRQNRQKLEKESKKKTKELEDKIKKIKLKWTSKTTK